ncbi:frequency clock protein [Hypoxylon crocopeplum]|nr:frequency clock protein [Hypoxylon crocopeplum]
MPNPRNAPAGSEPPPTVPAVTYKNPRRTSPENSITLRHHRLARDSKRNSPPAAHAAQLTNVQLPRRNSSGDSNETSLSDPKMWFDVLNQNSKGSLDTKAMAMDIDPPFYQKEKETDSSNEEAAKFGIPSQSPTYRFVRGRTAGMRPGMAHSSSHDDFRSVIDDLTIENKRLKEELRKYKQVGPDSLQRDKLFEVKFHGLSSRKKRELEATLRDFTTSLTGSSTGASPSRTKTSSKSKNIHSSASKHASSSSGSNWRPVDSAYASMSQEHGSSNPSLPGQAKAARQRSEQNIKNYLRDIPEGLWPRQRAMTEKDKKKLVVKRLEHLFTGKMGDPAEHVPLSLVPEPIVEDVPMEGSDDRTIPPSNKAIREAQIRPQNSRRKDSSPHGNGSASNSHSVGDRTELRDNGNVSGTSSRNIATGDGGSGGGNGSSASPHTSMQPLEQRPTRPRDLDPDRKQVPSENMDYIRHLGLVAPESQKQFSSRDVSPDAEGWVYLNLLCNLAQLHILNVTPAFIRNAVSERSAKFQLSPDGRKIRWRGGIEGTKFNSDSTSYSQLNQSSDDTDGSDGQGQRKKQKTKTQTQTQMQMQMQMQTHEQTSGNDVSARNPSKFGLGVQHSNSTESFHYKPLFVHHQTASSDEQPSGGDETGSLYGPPDESNLGMNSRWGQSGGSGVSQRKRRRDGAIIYYSGAPFCTDLSGDFGEGEASPTTYDMTSSGDRSGNVDRGYSGDHSIQGPKGPASLDMTRPYFSRSTSGSSLPFRPLSTRDNRTVLMDLDSDLPGLTSGETDDGIEADFPWSNTNQRASLLNLEATGLGGVYPEDHFVVVVSTRRPKSAHSDENNASVDDDDETLPTLSNNVERGGQETTDLIIKKLATMTTSSPGPLHVPDISAHTVQIEYLTGRVRRLPPVPLPPPAFYYPSSESYLDDDDDDDGSADDASSESLISRLAILEDDPSSNVDLSGNDEEDEDSDDHNYDASGSISPEDMGVVPDVSGSRRDLGPSKLTTGSSAATAGGAVSGYNSGSEEDA